MKNFMKGISLSVACASALLGATSQVALSTGWNAIGPNSQTTLAEIQSQLGTNLLNIQSPDGTKTYNSTSTRTPSFTQFEIGTGYWIKVSSAGTLNVEEVNFTTDQVVQLKSGWNLIDPLSDITLESIKTQLGNKLLNIQSPDGTKTYNSTSTRTPSFANFTSTLGYWVKLNADANLTFPFTSSALSNDAKNGQLNGVSTTYKTYTVKVLTDATTSPSLSSNISIYGTINGVDLGDGLAVNASYPVGTQFQLQVLDANGNVVATSPTKSLTTQMTSDSFFYMDDIAFTESTTSASTSYTQTQDAYGISTQYDMVVNSTTYKVKVFANDNVTISSTDTGIYNVPVIGSLNGVNTGYNLNINTKYVAGDKIVVKVYDATGNTLLTESAPITYAGNGTPINFGQLFATVTTTADTTPPATPTVSAATANSVYVTAEAGSIIKVKSGSTVIATSTGTGASKAIYFPMLTSSATLSITATDAAGNVSDVASTYAHVATTTTANAAPTMAVKSKSYTFEAGNNVEIDFKSQLGVTDPNGDYVRFTTNLPFFGMSMSIDGEYEGSPIAGTYTGKVKACDTFNACVESENITIQVNQPQSNTGTDNGYIELPIVYGAPATIPNLANQVTLYQPNGGDGYEMIAINTPSSGSVTVTPYKYDGSSFVAQTSEVGTYTLDTTGNVVVNMGAEKGAGIFNILSATNIAMYGQSGVEYMTSWTQTSYGTQDDYKVQTEWSSYLSQVSINSIDSFRNIMMATTSGGAWLWTQNGSRVLGTDGKVYPVQIIFNTDGSQQKGTVGATPIAGSSWNLIDGILSVSSDGSTQKYKFETPTGLTTPVLMASYQDALNVPYTMAAYSTANIAEMIVKEMYNQHNNSSTGGYIPDDSELVTLTSDSIANKQLTIDLNGNTAMVTFLSGSTQTYTITSPTYNEVGTWSISSGKIAFSRPGAENYYVALSNDMIHGYMQVGTTGTKTPVTIYSMEPISPSIVNNAPYFIGSYAPISMIATETVYSKDLSELFYDDGGASNLTYTVYGLPAGLSYASGVISGTPSVGGVYNAQIQACDTQSYCASGMIYFDIFASTSTVDMPPQTPDVEIAPPAIPSF